MNSHFRNPFTPLIGTKHIQEKLDDQWLPRSNLVYLEISISNEALLPRQHYTPPFSEHQSYISIINEQVKEVKIVQHKNFY